MWNPKSRVEAIFQRGNAWIERQDPASPQGVAIGAWRHYRAIEGPLQSALLSLYVLVAVLPALLVMEEYLEARPAALANHLIHHYGLNASTAELLRNVLVQDRTRERCSSVSTSAVFCN
jgi:hypothetical protein